MSIKPNGKPVVLGWLNPPANGRLTIKQNKIKQERAGFGSSNQNQNPPHLLVSQPVKKGFLSWFFFLRAHPKRENPAPQNTVFNRFSTEFSTIARKKGSCNA